MRGSWMCSSILVVGWMSAVAAHDTAVLLAPGGGETSRGEARARDGEIRFRGEGLTPEARLTIRVGGADFATVTTEVNGSFDVRRSGDPGAVAGMQVEVVREDGSTALSGKLPGAPTVDDDGQGEATMTPPAGAPISDASGKIEVKGEDGRHAIEVKVRRLAEGAVYTVCIASTAGETVPLGKITAGAGGVGALEVDTHDGGSLPFGAAGVAELAGLAVSVKDAEGTVVLAGRVPVLGQDQVEEDEVEVEFDLIRTAAATAGLRGDVRIETERGGEDKFRVRVREAVPGAVFTATIHRPVEGEEPVREELFKVTIDDGDRGETEIRGDAILPLNAASLAELGGAVIEVVDAEGKVVLQGTIPQVGNPPVPPVDVPRLAFDVILARPGPAVDADANGKVEFEEEDDEHEIEVELQDLVSSAAYKVELRDSGGDVAVLFDGAADAAGDVRHKLVFFGSEPLPLGATSFAAYDGDSIAVIDAGGTTVLQGTIEVPGAGGGAALGVSFAMVGEYDAAFLRGDADRNLELDITDPVRTLETLFLGRPFPVCADALDANDDGELDIADPVLTLIHLFQGGRELPYPGTRLAGFDRTADDLFCRDDR